ncbi:hypothetical protein BC937DRAFT_92286 [Endogone sp. FLAS-F59071]|nr:hypothetical protein BC937DRAFT_92286 [Endogone sp. FLAS-F59071]|eukprot:RUS21552.1 hypothetical protein BC937DRAFT_92286 [Endogone sp. FLAS-F59071]
MLEFTIFVLSAGIVPISCVLCSKLREFLRDIHQIIGCITRTFGTVKFHCQDKLQLRVGNVADEVT